MSTTVPRFIIVDDVDSSIQYIGPWFPDQGSTESVGNFGPAYQNTLHGANSNASLLFAFSGTQVRVMGSNNLLNTSGVLDPTWECFIDSISIGATTPFQFPENNWVFCEQDTLLDEPHILTVNATVSEKETFWFDDIQYVPSASVSLDQAAIIVDSLDPQLQYGPGWVALGSTANMTTVAGSIFTFNFTGVSLSWYGFIPNELPLSPSPAAYSIDGGTPVNFTLQGIPPKTATTYNQKFFETAQLSPGPHKLEAVYQGVNSTPLVLDYLIIQNGTLASTTTSASSLATSATTGSGVSSTSGSNDSGSSGSSQGKSSTPVGAIVGGVIAGLALVIFVILGGILLRRRKKRAAQEEVFIETTPKPFDYTPLPRPSITPNPSSMGGISYSPVPQTARSGSAVTHGAKGRTYHAPLPSVTVTDVSQSIEPPSTSSGVTTYPKNSRSVALQQTALTVANSSSRSPPASAASVPSPPVPLPSKVEREAEALASLIPRSRGSPSIPASVQSNDPVVLHVDRGSPSIPASVQSNDPVVLHVDSGIRMASSTASTTVTDIPPSYTPD